MDLSYVVTFKSTLDISQKFLAFSEYMNFFLEEEIHCFYFIYNEQLTDSDF